MTLIRKHERVDGKFDVEPREIWSIIAFVNYSDVKSSERMFGWEAGWKHGDMLHVYSKSDPFPWSSVIAYIDPSEEVAPVEVERVRGILYEPTMLVHGEPLFNMVICTDHISQVANLLNLKIKEQTDDAN